MRRSYRYDGVKGMTREEKAAWTTGLLEGRILSEGGLWKVLARFPRYGSWGFRYYRTPNAAVRCYMSQRYGAG